ncbi:15736_t:CDS:2, partial [Funneliformis caledonium]
SAFYDFIDCYASSNVEYKNIVKNVKINIIHKNPYFSECIGDWALYYLIRHKINIIPSIIVPTQRYKIINTYSANNKRLEQNKNLMPNSEYQEYNSDDQTNSSVIESEAVSNINIIKKKINKTKDIKSQVKPVSIKRIEYTSLDEVDSITEINKTKNIKSQVESASAKRVKRMS